jgi:hypothetical protein
MGTKAAGQEHVLLLAEIQNSKSIISQRRSSTRPSDATRKTLSTIWTERSREGNGEERSRRGFMGRSEHTSRRAIQRPERRRGRLGIEEHDEARASARLRSKEANEVLVSPDVGAGLIA